MRTISFFMAFLAIGLVLTSCDGGSDDGSSTSGSGEVAATTTAPTTQTTDTTTSSKTASGKITLDAFDDFSCSGNWTDRDGALGLKAYSGSGSCSASFPGPPGRYRISVKVQTEYDGRSPYRVSINGQTIKEGEYSLSSSLHCDCPHDDWRSVCPDRSATIDCGTHSLNTGDNIGFWGDDVYPCGDDHGAYAKWHYMTFTLVN